MDTQQIQANAKPGDPGYQHVPPTLGNTVDEVMRAFMRLSDEWCGICVIEALLPVTNAGPARKYRMQGKGSPLSRTRVGVSEMDGWALRDATPAEEDELEECIGLGFVQVSRFRPGAYRSGAVEVLHQATGRKIPAI